MANSNMNENSTIVVEIPQFVTERHKRRSSDLRSPAVHIKSKKTTGISTPPTTPLPSKKKVRFSDPGPIIGNDEEPRGDSTGLTPFISRTTINTASLKKKSAVEKKGSRRHSTPANFWNRADYDAHTGSATLQFAPLRQVLDGRIKRRLARNGLSVEFNVIEKEKRCGARLRRQELQRLRRAVEEKDREMDEMREELEVRSQIEGESGGIRSMQGEGLLVQKVRDLEEEIALLRTRLRERSQDFGRGVDWPIAAGLPCDRRNDDETSYGEEDHGLPNFDGADDIDFTTFNVEEMDTTPSRLKINHLSQLDTSILSPPSTLPNTPCRPFEQISEAVQTCFPPLPDPENGKLQNQLVEFRTELSNLTSALALHEDIKHRLLSKLSPHIPATLLESSSSSADSQTLLDGALDNVLTSLTLTQSSLHDSHTRFTALTNDILTLGFHPQDENRTTDPSVILADIAKQFRNARIELECLIPGETEAGFNPSALLELLLGRIKFLLKQVKERDETIDCYHETEVLLRQQINTRVQALDDVKERLGDAENLVVELRGELQDKEIRNERFSKALEGYRNEVASLEKLVSEMEKEGHELRKGLTEGREDLTTEKLRHETTRTELEGQALLVQELSTRLTTSLTKGAQLSARVEDLTSTQKAQATTIAEQDGELFIQNRKLDGLAEELETVSDSLKSAKITILELRSRAESLEAQVEGERKLGRLVVEGMKRSFAEALNVGDGYLTGSVCVEGQTGEVGDVSASNKAVVNMQRDSVMLDTGRRKRRYDSGLGFLTEEDEICQDVECTM